MVEVHPKPLPKGIPNPREGWAKWVAGGGWWVCELVVEQPNVGTSTAVEVIMARRRRRKERTRQNRIPITSRRSKPMPSAIPAKQAARNPCIEAA